MDSFPVCTHCGFTLGEYRSRGLLGCPHCYASFGDALQADLLWMHHALEFSASPGPHDSEQPPGRSARPDPEILAHWKRNLAEALKVENYGEASRLRLLIQNASMPDGPADRPARDAKPRGPGGQGPGGQSPGERSSGEGRTGGGLGLA